VRDDHADIFARAMHWIDVQVLADGRPDVLAIEEPVAPFQMQGQTQWSTTQIALGLQAIFMGAARRHGIKIITAPIRSWRKYALGHGALKGTDAKARMVRLVHELGFGDEDTDHNAAEAAGIWLYAGAQVAPMQVVRSRCLFAGTDHGWRAAMLGNGHARAHSQAVVAACQAASGGGIGGVADRVLGVDIQVSLVGAIRSICLMAIAWRGNIW
jgi:hypothetical protein